MYCILIVCDGKTIFKILVKFGPITNGDIANRSIELTASRLRPLSLAAPFEVVPGRVPDSVTPVSRFNGHGRNAVRSCTCMTWGGL